MITNLKIDTFTGNDKVKNPLLAIDCIYFNGIFHTEAKLQFVTNKPNEWVKFDINRPNDESIIETKIYF